MPQISNPWLPSHHHIIASSHHHIITSPHYHIIPNYFPPRFKANEFRQLCSLKNIMRIKKSLRLKTLIVHISNSWVQNRTVSFWTKHSIVKNLFKKQNISTSHLHNFQCSSEPSKTQSFHLYLVNFVIEITCINFQSNPKAFVRNERKAHAS